MLWLFLILCSGGEHTFLFTSCEGMGVKWKMACSFQSLTTGKMERKAILFPSYQTHSSLCSFVN